MTQSRSIRLTRAIQAAVLLAWPLLIHQAPQQAYPYVELSTRWDNAPLIETSLPHLVAAMVCPVGGGAVGGLVAIDSSGNVVELQFDGTKWTDHRRFSLNTAITSACAGMPQHDRLWRIYAGTRDGRLLELSRGDLGWTTSEFFQVTAPVRRISASNPGLTGVSQLFVTDGDGHVTNLWIAGDGKRWVPRDLPDLPGGIIDLCFDYHSSGLRTIAVNEAGAIHKFVQDSLGRWAGDLWTQMPVGPIDMAPSADPTMKDIALYYSGQDGNFRYLFYDHKTDDVARVPAAEGTSHVLGKDDQLRFNEFFGLNGGEFCLFEFNFEVQQWVRLPQKTISSPIVSVNFGPGRGGHMRQIYVATVDGAIHEFVRQASKIVQPED